MNPFVHDNHKTKAELLEYQHGVKQANLPFEEVDVDTDTTIDKHGTHVLMARQPYIVDWEADYDHVNDIYKIAFRVIGAEGKAFFTVDGHSRILAKAGNKKAIQGIRTSFIAGGKVVEETDGFLPDMIGWRAVK